MFVFDRLERFEGKVFELPLQIPNTEARCQRCINRQRLFSHPLLAIRCKPGDGLKVVEPVCKLDDHHPEVTRHGQQNLAKVFGTRACFMGTLFGRASDKTLGGILVLFFCRRS